MLTARPAPRRPGQPPRQLTQIAAPPAAQRVAGRPSTHRRDGVLAAAGGLAAFGAAPLAGHPGLALPALVGGLAVGSAVLVTGERGKRRRELEARALEALAPLLGVRHLDRRIIKLTKWTSGWPGLPRRVRLHYAPGIPDGDPAWKGEVATTLAARLLATYEVVRHDQRRCTLWLELVPDHRPVQAPPQSQVRAERALTELIGPTAKVTDVDLDGERLISFTVSHMAGAKLAASGYRARVDRVVSTMLPGRWRAAWDLENDTAHFELRPALPTSVWLPIRDVDRRDEVLSNYRNFNIPYAIDEDGREATWYPARVPHLMLSGGTGTGKTSSAHGLVGQITQYGFPVWVLDAKRVEFLDFRTWPNVQIVAGSIAQQVALIRAAWNLMEYRYELIEEGRATVEDFEPLFVVLDEYAEFRSNLYEWYAQVKAPGKGGDPTKPPTLAEVASMARKARTARIHLILSTQRPDSEFLGGEMRDNFGQRMSMGRLSPQGAMMMWENPAIGVSLPRACTGRAIATSEDGRPVEVQAYRFPDMHAPEGSEERRLLESIRPGESLHPRLIVVPPESTADDKGEIQAPTFRDYANAKWDLAENRPDLDPLTRRDGPDAGRALASPLASLGIAGATEGRPSERPRLRLLEVAASSDEMDGATASGEWVPEDEYGDYAAATCCPHQRAHGWRPD